MVSRRFASDCTKDEKDRIDFAAAEEVRKYPERWARPRLPSRPATLPDEDDDILTMLRANRKRKVPAETAQTLRTFAAWRAAVEKAEVEAEARLEIVRWALVVFRRLEVPQRLVDGVLHALEDGWGLSEDDVGLELEGPEWRRLRSSLCADLDLLPEVLRFGEYPKTRRVEDEEDVPVGLPEIPKE